MVNKNIEENINDARNLIKEEMFSEAEVVLGLNKAFVHDEKLKTEIFEKEKQVAITYNSKKIEAEKDIDNSNPWRSYNKFAYYDLQLRLWRVQELLSFWDMLNKKL